MESNFAIIYTTRKCQSWTPTFDQDILTLIEPQVYRYLVTQEKPHFLL